MAKYKTKNCEYCGKEFVYQNARAKCCSGACGDKLRAAKYKTENDRRRIKKMTTNNELVLMAIEAREHGMSYGQYASMQYAPRIAKRG